MLARITISVALLSMPVAAFAEGQSQSGDAAQREVLETAPHAASGPMLASLATDSEEASARYAPKPEVEDLIRAGNKNMRDGDILGARGFYQKAFASGDAAAALVMGRSYDPIYFARIAARNAEPDPAKAFEWYELARNAGAGQTAVVRIEDLKRFMGK
jgi:TPR repeat protein